MGKQLTSMKTILVAAFLTIGLSSCFEKDLSDPTNGGEDEPETLNGFFGFNTTKDVKLNIKYNVPQGYGVSFEVYDVNPLSLDRDGQIVKQEGLTSVGLGSTDKDGNFSGTLSVPATLKQVYIYSSAAGVRAVMQAEIVGGVVSVSDDNDKNLVNWEESANVRANATFSNSKEVSERGSLLTLGLNNAITWEPKGGEPLNIDGSETDKFGAIQTSVLTAVNAVLKESQSPKGLVMGDDYTTDLTTKDGKVYIRYVSGKSSSLGTLAYYCYPENANLTKDYIEKLPKCLVFANTMDESWDPSNTSLKKGTCVELKYINSDGVVTNEVFPAKTHIGFVLYNNGYRKGSGSNSQFNLTEPFYSTPIKGVARFGYTATFTYTDKEHGDLVLMGFEDWTGKGADYNDFVFNVTGVEGTTFREEDITTIDGALTRGTLAFEDNWPSEGDYDMNDLIVKYTSQPSYTGTTYLGTSKVTYSKEKIVDTFTLVWAGAGYKNGFGYKVNLGDDVEKTVVKCNGKEIPLVVEKEADGSQVIILFTDARKELGLGNQSAADMAGKEVTPVTFEVTTIYKKGESPQIPVFKGKAPYNPFISVNTNRAHEIHLIDNAPTSKMRQDLWGKEADTSVPGKGEYYRNKEYWPFAINVDASGNNNAAWDVNKKLSAVEAVRIDVSYPDFIKWANSKGTNYTTWWNK